MIFRTSIAALLALALQSCTPAFAQATYTPPAPLVSIPVNAQSITPCFTLTSTMDCGKLIVDAVDAAKSTLDIQAYNFTEQHIIAAIQRAKMRGLAVRVILDKISPSQQCEGADPVKSVGVPVWIDRKPKIAHNKVMIIDGQAVITGSFNFSTNAEESNAENTNLIVSPALAALYEQNFSNRLAQSVEWDGSHAKPVKACSLPGDSSASGE